MVHPRRILKESEEEFNSGLPSRFFSDDGDSITYEIKTNTGKIHRAFIDPNSRGVSNSSGWREEKTGTLISSDYIIGWRRCN